MKILMVCLGNICRSPLAEGILKDKVIRAGLDWKIDSAGTGDWHIGSSPDPRSQAVARKYGIDITQQRGRQITTKDLGEYDLIFAMDSSNYQDILKLATTEDQKKKVYLIMNVLDPRRNLNVPDPYWNDNGFENVYRMLDQACDMVLNKFNV